MQYRPSAAELLGDIATLLEQEVLGVVDGPLQHRVRVAANLVRIVERERQLGPAADDHERARLAALLGDDDIDLTAMRQNLAARLRDPVPLDPDVQRAIYDALVTTVRADLAISKPGYDAWDAEA